ASLAVICPVTRTISASTIFFASFLAIASLQLSGLFVYQTVKLVFFPFDPPRKSIQDRDCIGYKLIVVASNSDTTWPLGHVVRKRFPEPAHLLLVALGHVGDRLHGQALPRGDGRAQENVFGLHGQVAKWYHYSRQLR